MKNVKDLVELPLKHPEIFSRLGIEPPRGILLVGPPGTGKTLLARAIAQECGVNFKLVNGPEIIRKFYGESEALLRDIFQNASENQPSIIFIDEIDALAPKRDKVHGEVEKRIVGQLLALMDGLRDRGKVIVLAATNMPNLIDSALRRPGRFDKEIVLDPPNSFGRREILETHTRGMPLNDNVDLDSIANITSGFVGADIEMLCKDAALVSIQEITKKDQIDYEILDSITVSNEDFMEALKNIQPSAIREIFVEIPKVTWNEIGGLVEVKKTLEKVVIDSIKNNKNDVRMPKGIMLYGPPGTGKTMLAAATANEMDGYFINVDASAMMSKWLGEAEKNVSKLFSMARHYAEKEGKPVILFVDEVDSLLGSRNSEVGGEVRTKNQFLTEMDGVNGKGKDLMLYVIGATNKPWSLDWPFLRRFQKRIYVSLPSLEAREHLFKEYTEPLRKSFKVNPAVLAKLFDGYSASDIKDICQSVQLKVVNEMFSTTTYKEPVEGENPSKPRDITMKDFRETILRRKPSVSMDMIRAYYKWSEQFKAL